jgi:heme A synthase
MDHWTNSPWISRLAKLCVVLTFCLILLGAIVTTSGAGMAAPAAPHVDGTLLNPNSPVTQTVWWKDPALLREHGHRLVAMSLGLAVGMLAAALWRNWFAFAVSIAFMGAAEGLRPLKLDPSLIAQLRVWPAMILFVTLLVVGTRRRGEKPAVEQWMGLAAYIATCTQALLGSLRVNLETAGNIAAATDIRTFHGVFAQAFLAFLVVLAARLSPRWSRLATPLPAAGKIYRMAVAAMVLYFAQISCAAYLRHRSLGLAIASWPAAQADPGWSASGRWLPAAWPFPVCIHFLHTRILPVLLLGHFVSLGVSLMKRARSEPLLARLGLPLSFLIAAQFALGVLVVTLYVHGVPRQPHITNTHVITGALLIAIIALVIARAGRLRTA